MTTLTLKAQKFTSEDRFPVRFGYVLHTGDWGVVNSDGDWVAFGGKLYRPAGGRKAALEVAAQCDPNELEYISTL